MEENRTTSRGYSLVELLVVVGIVGIVALVTVPALLQLMPQYRIRSAASEAAGNIKMVRQRAISTRSAWRISFDPANNRYRYYMLRTPNLDLAVEGNWQAISRDGQSSNNTGDSWILTPSVDVNTTAHVFKDVTCPADGMMDIIFLRDGSISDKAACGDASTDVLTFKVPSDPSSVDPSLVFAVDSNYVRFNRYYITTAENGLVSIRSAKE